MTVTINKSVKEKRAIAIANLRAYISSLPRCMIPEYDNTERTEHEHAQSRIVEICADDKDKTALAELLLGFIYWYSAFNQQQPPTWGELKERLHEEEITLPTSDPVIIGERQVLACLVSCQCAYCAMVRTVGSGLSPSDVNRSPAEIEDRIKAALSSNADLDKKAKA